ncbi:DUF2304 domain-containing protein [Paenibacillus sp. UNC499MF]|uniref:DUF2304 domain-containing protein n=1 Tax=Paenibacillus sp. UNC499MF TaxID=1502751 RepID=UPI0008A089B7|nr:DUF2304 domain-containing protein [Paenibacillus sp. UNC499MF]SEG74468.1 hypothetical protein SAMN02799616_04712 [Paenibacillus sp. UNC499MF]
MIQAITIGVTVIFLFQILFYTSKHKLRDRHAFTWIMIALAGLVTGICIPLLNRFALWIGVSYMPSLIFLIVIVVTLSLLVHQTILLSKQQEQIKTLAQEHAYLENEVMRLKEQSRNQESYTGAGRREAP